MGDPAWRRLGWLPAWPILAVLAMAASAFSAEAPSHPVVAGFERFGSGPKADATEPGLLLLGELGCTSCHRPPEGPAGAILPKAAPVLDAVGARVRPSHLKAFLAAPHAVKPGTTMPDVFAGWDTQKKEDAVDALVQFLGSTGTPAPSRLSRKLIAEGRSLYGKVGCVACHGDAEATPPIAGGNLVPLGDLAAKYNVPGLAAFLADPLKARPSGRMPGLGLANPEANAIAQYLLRSQRGKTLPNLEYRYYEGDWEALPALDKLTPVATSKAEGFDLGVAKRSNNMAIRFEGLLTVDTPGMYTFFLTSDDGSKLYIDGAVVVDNDGIHAPGEKRASLRLAKGTRKVAVEFFNGGAGAELEVEYRGPGVPRQDLGGRMSLPGELPGATESVDRLVINPDLVTKGRALFASLGCASCHQMKVGDEVVASRVQAKALSELKAGEGCLAGEPKEGVPNFGLSPGQRTAIAAALAALPDLGANPPTPKASITRTMTALNCYACHEREGRGGVEAVANGAFQTTQKEMGDEGRIPPRLDGAGAKLKGEYLAQLLANGGKDRPYMLTRMPKFGPNAAPLAGWLAATDKVEPVAEVTFEEPPKRVKSDGRSIVGGLGLGCVKCHTFNGSEAEGVQAIDMTLMARRLNRDWFHRYVVNPPAFRPGTRMPTGWPDGKSMLPKVLGGDTAHQVEAVWEYLGDGTKATEPYGLGREPMPIFALKEAVIYRNFIQGGGPRAIGVGYPEKANLAFDADGSRLAMLWQGGFIDAARHWTGRGVGYQAPMGDNVVSLPGGPAFANLSDPANPWPTQAAKALGVKFRGYRLGENARPTFLYEMGATRVEDTPAPRVGAKSAGFSRTIRLTSERPPDDLWFRAAVGETIVPLPDGWFLVNGEWKVKLGGGAMPVVRDSAGKKELVAPVRFDGKAATLVEQFDW